MPIFALMDNDPHGLDIYACYKWGARVSCSFVKACILTPLTQIYVVGTCI